MDPHAPDVSVVIAATRPRLLAEALASVGRQTYAGMVEVVVVHDGGSPLTLPDGPFVGRSLALPERRGPAAARNLGLSYAQAPTVAFLDDDDLWHEDHLAKTVPLALATGGLVYTDALILHREEGWLRPFRFPYTPALLRRTNPIILSSVVLGKQLLTRVGGFAEDLLAYEDWDLFLRLEAAGVPFARVAEPTITYRYSARSVSHDAVTTAAAFATFCARHGLKDLPQLTFAAMAQDPDAALFHAPL
jgi:glycosyltransferase involved in cell wall biosynthesis